MSSRLVLATVVLVAMLIGGNFTALKFALDHTTPVLLAGMRTVVGGTFLLGFAFIRGERLPKRRVDYQRILVVSLSITTISSALLVFGVNRVSAGLASLMSSTMPMFTAVLSFFLLGVSVSFAGRIGLAVGFAGTIVLASPSLGGSSAAVGVFSLLVSAVAWAYGTVFMKWKDFSAVTPIMLVGIQLYMSAVVLIPAGLLLEGRGDTEWTLGLFAPLAYAAIPANAVTFSLIATVVQRATPTQAAATAYLVPVFGVFFGWLIRDERLGLVELAGGVLIVAGVYLLATGNTRFTEDAGRLSRS